MATISSSACRGKRNAFPPAQSELAQQLIKDPYDVGFLMLGPDVVERDIERGLLEHLRDLILELGKGLRICREPVPHRCRSPRLLFGPPLLSSAASLLRALRPKD